MKKLKLTITLFLVTLINGNLMADRLTEWFHGDINGDGYKDRVRRNETNGYWIANFGSANGTWIKYRVPGNHTKITDEFVFTHFSDDFDWHHVAGDFNGDGLLDVAAVRTKPYGDWWVATSEKGQLYGKNGAWGAWDHQVDWSNVQACYQNNDAFMDVVGKSRGRWAAFLSNGEKFYRVVDLGIAEPKCRKRPRR